MLEGLLQLDRSYIKPAAEMLAEAFLFDPMYEYMLPKREQRIKALPAIFRGMLSMYLAEGDVYATSANLEGIICVTGLRSGRAKLTWPAIRGALQMPFGVARRVPLFPMLKRASAMRRGVSEYRRIKEEFKDGVYIDLVAVAEKHRGRKFMSKMIRPVLLEAGKAGRRCALDTESEHNILIYQHFGFNLFNDIVAVPGKLHFNMMVCEPGEMPKDEGTEKAPER
jgi:GNAT superfamily N-acetyltransferase